MATLIYLSAQMRQATASMSASAMNASAEANAQVFIEMITNPQLVDLMLKAASGVESLDANERIRYLLLINSAMRYFENHYMMYRDKALPQDAWESNERNIPELLATKGARQAWDANKHFFADEFRTLVDSLPPSDGAVLIKETENDAGDA